MSAEREAQIDLLNEAQLSSGASCSSPDIINVDSDEDDDEEPEVVSCSWSQVSRFLFVMNKQHNIYGVNRLCSVQLFAVNLSGRMKLFVIRSQLLV